MAMESLYSGSWWWPSIPLTADAPFPWFWGPAQLNTSHMAIDCPGHLLPGLRISYYTTTTISFITTFIALDITSRQQ